MAKPCEHVHFNYHVKMIELGFEKTDRVGLMLELTAQCDECGEPFVFTDMEVDDSPQGSMRFCTHVSSDGQRARLPVAAVSRTKLVRENLN